MLEKRLAIALIDALGLLGPGLVKIFFISSLGRLVRAQYGEINSQHSGCPIDLMNGDRTWVTSLRKMPMAQ